MGTKRDYYAVLGVGRDADETAIKRAYRKLAKKYHPDTNAGDSRAEQQFKEITEAYAVLSDPEKRKLYDQFGHAAFDGSAGPSGKERTGPFEGGFGEYRRSPFDQGDMEDLFGDLFGDMFRQRTHFRARGGDVEAEIEVRFEEAAFGCDKMLSVPDPAAGRARSLQVHIPAGIDSGNKIRLQGKGMPGRGGGEAGDLLLKVKIMKKPGFERKGMDVYTSVRIPFTTAALGGEALVSTLYGNVLCRIREGTQPGTKIRLKGKGIVSMKNPQIRGDQYVEVQIEVPRTLSQDAKRKLREFDEEQKKTGAHGGYGAA